MRLSYILWYVLERSVLHLLMLEPNAHTFMYIFHISVASHVYGIHSTCKSVTYALMYDGTQFVPVTLTK